MVRPLFHMDARRQRRSRMRCAWPSRRRKRMLRGLLLMAWQSCIQAVRKRKQKYRISTKMTGRHAYRSFSLRLLAFFLAFGRSTHLSNATIEIWVVPFLGGIAALFPHLRKVVWAILCHIGFATF